MRVDGNRISKSFIFFSGTSKKIFINHVLSLSLQKVHGWLAIVLYRWNI